MTNHELANRIHCQRIVTTQRGSWKWQDAFRINTYTARLMDDGRVLWETANAGNKVSEPQLREWAKSMGYSSLRHGSMHNVPVSYRDAVKCLGAPRARQIENSGWAFSRPA
jgi:hypothetical protein